MSAGHKDDPDPFTFAVAQRIMALSIVRAMYGRTFSVNSTDYDIPYVAGYSQDGSTIYIDRDLPLWPYRGKTVNTRPFLITHEHVEKSLIDAIHIARQGRLRVLLAMLRMKSPDDQIYYHCHGVATAMESHAVLSAYGTDGLTSYNKFMESNVKLDEDERIIRVPADLDLTPYRGSDLMDERLRRAIREHQVK